MSRPSTARTVRVVDVIGNAEVRRLAARTLQTGHVAVTRHTLLLWRKKRGFPEPIKRLESGEVWNRQEVRAWLAERSKSES